MTLTNKRWEPFHPLEMNCDDLFRPDYFFFFFSFFAKYFFEVAVRQLGAKQKKKKVFIFTARGSIKEQQSDYPHSDRPAFALQIKSH